MVRRHFGGSSKPSAACSCQERSRPACIDARTRVLKVMTQHLQAVPLPPSERTELPIPAVLERLVVACLAKVPDDRPQNARQLAQSLDAIDGVRWSEDEAARWWNLHHPPPIPASVSDAITL